VNDSFKKTYRTWVRIPPAPLTKEITMGLSETKITVVLDKIYDVLLQMEKRLRDMENHIKPKQEETNKKELLKD
tara:strand:+ start:31 stop:252 length:222 start_codon:yes stop_codon:yes gene_type:complete